MTKQQATIPKEVIGKLLAAAGPELILIGGQSLAIWMDRYGVKMPGDFDYVSRDLDFLAASAADKESVRRLARAFSGRSAFPLQRAALTSLIGQAIHDVSESEVFNVDVLHKMWGAKREVVWDRAITVADGPVEYRVLHPLDVLKSRLDNLHGLKEKQNDLGKAQLLAAIEVARAFQREAALAEPAGGKRPVTLRYVGFIEQLATADAGKKVAVRYRIHVADAIEPDAVPSKEFRQKRLPQLGKLMSPARRKELSLPA